MAIEAENKGLPTENEVIDLEANPNLDEKVITGEILKEELEGEVVITLEGESLNPEDDEANKAPEWVKELRKSHKELARKNRELEEQLKLNAPVNNAVVTLGDKPTLESCDFDPERFETDLEAWHNRKREVSEAEGKKQAEAEKANAEWQATVANYTNATKELKVTDFNDAQELVKDTLTIVQQGIILQGAKNAATVVYALGKHPGKARELAAIKDPIKFAFEVARFEGMLKVSAKKAPPPERIVTSSSGKGISAAVDSQLERLRAEAEKTGNYSKVVAYKNSLRK